MGVATRTYSTSGGSRHGFFSLGETNQDTREEVQIQYRGTFWPVLNASTNGTRVPNRTQVALVNFVSPSRFSSGPTTFSQQHT